MRDRKEGFFLSIFCQFPRRNILMWENENTSSVLEHSEGDDFVTSALKNEDEIVGGNH